MAEYYTEGLLERLLGLGTNGSVDGTTCNVLEMYTFYIVPNMNPDGAVRGHLRTNAWLWWCQSQSARTGIHWYYSYQGRGKLLRGSNHGTIAGSIPSLTGHGPNGCQCLCRCPR